MATFKVEHFGTAPRNDQAYIADRNLYLDAEGNLVEEDNPAQVKQLVGKGGALSSEDAKKYGLMGKKKAEKPEAAEATEEEVDGGEKASSPSANKAAKPAKNKGAK